MARKRYPIDLTDTQWSILLLGSYRGQVTYLKGVREGQYAFEDEA